MANKFRNELEVKLGGVDILLRPTFENLSAMESDIGGIGYLGYKFSRGVRLENGKLKEDTETAIKNLPTLTEAAKIIFHNQAATDPNDSTKKKYSLEEIWDMVLIEGASVSRQVMKYVVLLTAGDKNRSNVDELNEEEKKS